MEEGGAHISMSRMAHRVFVFFLCRVPFWVEHNICRFNFPYFRITHDSPQNSTIFHACWPMQPSGCGGVKRTPAALVAVMVVDGDSYFFPLPPAPPPLPSLRFAPGRLGAGCLGPSWGHAGSHCSVIVMTTTSRNRACLLNVGSSHRLVCFS